jgi:RNA polymerase sigma-70 factor (ECF subfamily)
LRVQTDEDELVTLMTAYQAGRLHAFETLYARLAPELAGYFGAVTHDASVTADLVQDTFLEMHRSRRTYLAPLPVRPWVFGIARHVRHRHWRVTLKRARHEDAVDVPPEQAAPEAARPAVHAHDVREALEQLPATRRDAWLLHHVHGFSFQEIAVKLRIGAGAAKLRSSRAMRALRALLGIERNTDE